MSGKSMPQKSLPRNSPEQGDIVLVEFSYSDLKRSKFRPALVISTSRYNVSSLDVVVLRITSKPQRVWAIKITNNDLETGFLEVVSYVKIDSLYTVEQKMVAKIVATLNAAKLAEVKLMLRELFDLG
jgi:mRNA interferase MazF